MNKIKENSKFNVTLQEKCNRYKTLLFFVWTASISSSHVVSYDIGGPVTQPVHLREKREQSSGEEHPELS